MKCWMLRLVVTVLLQQLQHNNVASLYVSYETYTSYSQGESIPIIANKLTSASKLAALDYVHLALCDESVSLAGEASTKWRRAVASLHGDAPRTSTLKVNAGEDVFCGTLCTVLVEADRVDAVKRDFNYNWELDGLPAALVQENAEIRTTRYWGGIPVGRLGAEFTSTGETDARFQNTLASDVFLYNHWNINIAYRTTPNEKYEIVRFWVEPFSVQHDSNNNNVASCASDSTSHTDYTQLANVPVQSATGFVKFTYDVRWIAMDESNIHYSDRWDIYLDMDDATPDYIEFLGAFLGVFLLCVLAGSLFTWVQRDLSYKPLVESVVQDIEHVSDDGAEFTDEQTKEVQMWPLSTHVFFPPVTSPLALCIACGTGAHLFIAGFWFILLFRCGIINQSQGDKLLTPGAILYSLTSPLAGYVTARLYAILHGDRLVAMTASLVTAIAFPLLGILTLYLVYDVLPDDTKAPAYNVVSNSTPFILLWIFGIWPMTVLGGAVGYSHGPMQNFPVSTGTTGYHDLNLQNNNDEDHNPPNGNKKVLDKFSRYMHRYRCLIFFLTCGILPCLSSFISYSYAVAAPILIGSYSLRAYLVLSYLLFVAVAAATSLLLFYRQLRVHNYQWWWSSYAAGASAGLYTFLLSASWVLTKDANPNDAWRYTLWFAFVSFGVSLVTGFSSTAACVWFNRILYMVIMRRRHG